MPFFIYIGGLNPGSQTITSGSGNFTVPAFISKLRVRAFGAGAGGAGKSGTSSVRPTTAGGNTTFDTSAQAVGGGLTAGGAGGPSGQWVAGVASGGDTNTNGNAAPTSGEDPNRGNGAAAPQTALGGGAQAVYPPGNSTGNGTPGNAYAGGGSASKYWDGNLYIDFGGGSGAFVEKVYLPGGLGPGDLIPYAVGAGGPAGDGTSSDGGVGAGGALIIEWDYE